MEMLKARGVLVEADFADRQIRHIPHEKMSNYYNSIDVLICCSGAEGTPNPVLEAMACGVPVITTNVGVVDEAFGPQQKAFILRERTPAALTDAVEQLARNPALLMPLSMENRKSIKRWDWSIQTDAYRRFFRQHTSAGAVATRRR